MIRRSVFSGYGLPLFVTSVFLFLYLPIVSLIIFSFNDNRFGYTWQGFTTKWYGQLFQSVEVWDALKNSFLVAGSTVVLSITMASLLVFYLARSQAKEFLSFFYINLGIPEIVLAVGLLSFFNFFSIPLGMPTLIAAHTIIGLGYSVPIIYSRYIELDKRLIEASFDLGATPMQSFFTIIVPLVLPALLSSALLVFIVSLDNIILSFFCAGAETQTLPIYIFSVIRAGASPQVSALSTLLLCSSSLLVIIFSLLHVKRMGMPR